jgi:hypothetical protein
LKLSEKMKKRGYLKTSLFIKSHSRLMVTFTKIALSRGIRIPYTSNAIERYQSVASTNGCIVQPSDWRICSGYSLRRYTDPVFYHERFWNGYIHPSRYEMMDTT